MKNNNKSNNIKLIIICCFVIFAIIYVTGLYLLKDTHSIEWETQTLNCNAVDSSWNACSNLGSGWSLSSYQCGTGVTGGCTCIVSDSDLAAGLPVSSACECDSEAQPICTGGGVSVKSNTCKTVATGTITCKKQISSSCTITGCITAVETETGCVCSECNSDYADDGNGGCKLKETAKTCGMVGTSCSVTNGSGSLVDRGDGTGACDCKVTSCVTGYHPEGSSCVKDTSDKCSSDSECNPGADDNYVCMDAGKGYKECVSVDEVKCTTTNSACGADPYISTSSNTTCGSNGKTYEYSSRFSCISGGKQYYQFSGKKELTCDCDNGGCEKSCTDLGGTLKDSCSSTETEISMSNNTTGKKCCKAAGGTTSGGSPSGGTTSGGTTSGGTPNGGGGTSTNTNPSTPSSGGNVTNNPQTGQILIYIVWVIGLVTVVASVLYYRRVDNE